MLASAHEALVAAGASVNKPYKEEGGDTVLDFAARNGHAETVRVLLAAGALTAEVTRRNPAHSAAANGPTEVVSVFLKARMSVDAVDMTSPLGMGRVGSHASGRRCVSADRYNWSPLHRAASVGHTDVVKMLLAAGAAVNKDD